MVVTDSWSKFIDQQYNELINCSSVLNNRCILCEPGFYLTSEMVCASCGFGCETCLDNEICLNCGESYNLENGNCREICQEGIFYKDNESCLACSSCENCDNCNSCFNCRREFIYSVFFTSKSIIFDFNDLGALNDQLLVYKLLDPLEVVQDSKIRHNLVSQERTLIVSDYFQLGASNCAKAVPEKSFYVKIEGSVLIFNFNGSNDNAICTFSVILKDAILLIPNYSGRLAEHQYNITTAGDLQSVNLTSSSSYYQSFTKIAILTLGFTTNQIFNVFALLLLSTSLIDLFSLLSDDYFAGV